MGGKKAKVRVLNSLTAFNLHHNTWNEAYPREVPLKHTITYSTAVLLYFCLSLEREPTQLEERELTVRQVN